jgi:hypothetical protein
MVFSHWKINITHYVKSANVTFIARYDRTKDYFNTAWSFEACGCAHGLEDKKDKRHFYYPFGKNRRVGIFE